MNTHTSYISPKIVVPALVVLVLAVSAAFGQQGARLRIEHLERLENAAETTVDVTVDGDLLNMAVRALEKDNSPDAKSAKEFIAGLKGIYVRSFEFEAPNQYTPADVDMIRSQLSGPGWKRMVNVRSKHDNENVEVYTMDEGGHVGGLAILSYGAKELTVVNIVGTIDVDKLGRLDNRFGIPGIRFGDDRPESGSPAPAAKKP